MTLTSRNNNGAAPGPGVPRRLLNLERPAVKNLHRTAYHRPTGGQA